MRFIERVGCKALHLAENRDSRSSVDPAAHTALDNYFAAVFGQSVYEDLALALHYVVLLFAHGAAHYIRAAEAVARKLAENLHYLLLVHYAAVGYVENIFQRRVLISDMRRIVAAVDVCWNAVHRARAVKRKNGYQVLNTVGLQLGKHILHALALELEHAFGVALGNHGKNPFIVVADIIGAVLGMRSRDKLFRVVDHGEVAQSEKVHFQQSKLLQRSHRKLGNHVVVVF